MIGSSSAHFHILSSESREYFRNAILMSGSAESYWALSPYENHLQLAFKIAKHLGEPIQTYDEAVKLFKSLPAEEFKQLTSIVGQLNERFVITFAPVIESQFIIIFFAFLVFLTMVSLSYLSKQNRMQSDPLFLIHPIKFMISKM